MKSFRKELWFNILSRRALINITPQVREALQSGIQEVVPGECHAHHRIRIYQ